MRAGGSGRRPISIMFYNFKGGSGKTTTTVHTGFMLAKKGHNVLFIDADMQCNLTGSAKPRVLTPGES